jgi:hypothetical protein
MAPLLALEVTEGRELKLIEAREAKGSDVVGPVSNLLTVIGSSTAEGQVWIQCWNWTRSALR